MAELTLSDVMRALEDLRRDTSAEVAALRAALTALQERQAAAPPAPTAGAAAPVEEVSPETVVILAAVITAFLGKKVRIRSTRLIQNPSGLVNPWTQYGRVSIQASHDLPRHR